MRLTDLEGRVFGVLAARLTPGDPAPVAVALSGGSDSLAMLHLAAGWARANGRPLLALTVDHGLNPDSAGWTAFAGRAAAEAGAAWRALRWEGAKPAAGLPAAARAARHRLIADAAREAGASVILVGQTADDIAESRRMRAGGSTVPDPAVWSPAPVWPEGRGLFLLRPVLGERRDALKAWLTARGQAWIDDPGNDNPRFARARARADLASGAEAPPPPTPVAAWFPRHADATPDGRILMSPAAAAEGLIARAAVCAAGTAAAPGRDQLARLAGRIAEGGAFVASLAGARIESDGAVIAFARNPGEASRGGLAPIRVAPGETAVWDGRFAVVAEAPGRIVPAAGRLARLAPGERRALAVLPPKARATMPVFESDAGGLALPRPFGGAPARADCLVGARFAAACGWVEQERDIRARQ